MLRVNQLSGFGGLASPGLLVSLGSNPNTNSPAFLLDLGPPGLKQVLAVFACSDVSGNDPWDWGVGSVGGEPFTYVVPIQREQAGNGSNFTGGVTIRSLQTLLSGLQTVTIPVLGFSAIMTNNRMMALVTRGINPTPISYDGGTNQGASNGNNATLDTTGAKIVIAGAAVGSAPGDFQGPGNEVTPFTSSNLAFGYDLAPAGGGSDIYSFTGSKYVIAGAAFG